jgi:hypothetical protein
MATPPGRTRGFFQRELSQVMGDLRPLFSDLGQGFLWIFDWLSNVAFRMTAVAGKLRWFLLTLFCALFWVLLAAGIGEKPLPRIPSSLVIAQAKYVGCVVRFAVVGDENKYNRDRRCESLLIGRSFTFKPFLFEIPFQELFSADVLRRTLLMALACWLAYKAMARYQAKLYAVPAQCAEHYLLQAAAINAYNILNIQASDVQQDQRHLPIWRIGGPGYVCIHLDNAALFENANGDPRVIGPTVRLPKQLAVLEGFERLRKAILLRDHIDSFNLPGRTLDGIRISAELVEVNFSVFRDHQTPTYERPYPFRDPEAIENLVYQQGTGPWYPAAFSQVRGELGDFLAKNSLNEFLAMVGAPEIASRQQNEQNLLQRLSELNDPTASPPSPGASPPINPYTPRSKITDDFFKDADKRAKSKGAQVNWLGVGTWRFPAQVFDRKHQDAWRISQENLQRSNDIALSSLRTQQRLAETVNLIQTTPLISFKNLGGVGAELNSEALGAVIRPYYQRFIQAKLEYERWIQNLDDQIAAERDASRGQELTNQRNQSAQEMQQIVQYIWFINRFYTL